MTKDVTYVAQWTANTDTKYTVEYYYQENGQYPEAASDSVTRGGTTDTACAVTAEDKQPSRAGYVFDEAAGNVLEGTIAGDGSTVLKVYFKQQFTVTYTDGVDGQEIFADQKTGSLDYGAETPAFSGTPERDGYEFGGWTPAVDETVTKDVTYVAQWTANFSDFSITGNGETWVYDGSSRQIEVNGIYAGDKLTYTGSKGEVLAECDVTEDGVVDAPEFRNVSDSDIVTVTVTRGTESASAEAVMTINKRIVVLTSGSDSKVYDGAALTNSDVTVAGDGFVQGEGVQYTFTGSQTAVGTSDNTFEYTLNANTLRQNYDIQLVEGTLTVTPQSITPGPDPDNPDSSYNDVTVDYPENVPYDGTEHTWVPTVTDADGNVLVADRDYTVRYSTSDHTNVSGRIRVTITGIGNYTGSVERAYSITPLNLIVTADNITKYVGEADPALTSTYRGVLEGEVPGWSGSIAREPGEAVGTYAIDLNTLSLEDNPEGNFRARNYQLIFEIGTFTILDTPTTPDDGGDDTPTTPTTPTTPGDDGTGTGPNPTPAPGGTVTPADVADDAADDATTDDATPEETVTDDENPLASGDEEGIEDNGNPLASGRGDEDCWVHWLILVGMILTAVYFVGVAVRRRKFTADLLDYEDKVLGNNRNDA